MLFIIFGHIFLRSLSIYNPECPIFFVWDGRKKTIFLSDQVIDIIYKSNPTQVKNFGFNNNNKRVNNSLK